MTEDLQKLSISEEEFVRGAAHFLENPGFLIRMVNKIGVPLEKGLKSLPEKYSKMIHRATEDALHKGIEIVVTTVSKDKALSFRQAEEESRLSGYQHTAMAFGLGTVGGFMGMMSLPVELPLTTGVILRSIVNVAKEFHLDVTDPQVQMECLYILSLGSSKSKNDDEMDSAYWTSRVAFSTLINEAAKYVAANSLKNITSQISNKSAPAIVRLISAIATRFKVVVSEKLLFETIPVVGAIGGGAINATFTNYFSDAARFHFGLRHLELKYGPELVRECYHRAKESSMGS